MRQRRTFHTSSPAALLKLMVTIYSQRHVKAGSWLWDCQGRGKKVSWLNPNQCFHCYLNSHVCIGFKSQKKRWKGQSASLIFDAFSSSISKKSSCKISNTKSNCNFGSENCSSKTGRKKKNLNCTPTKGIQKTPIGIIVDAKKLCHQANGKPWVMPAPTLYMYISAMGGFRGFTSPLRHETPGIQWREDTGVLLIGPGLDFRWKKDKSDQIWKGYPPGN